MNRQDGKVCLGVVGGAHGVRGEFRVKTFTSAAEDVAAYGPLDVGEGDSRSPSAAPPPPNQLTLRIIRVVKADLVIARAREVASREAVAALTGRKLFVDRVALPDTDDEDDFYVEDLVGLRAVLPDGSSAGVVAAVHNFGAGDLLELRGTPGARGSLLIRFSKANAPVVDIAGGVMELAADALDEGVGEPEPGDGEAGRDEDAAPE